MLSPSSFTNGLKFDLAEYSNFANKLSSSSPFGSQITHSVTSFSFQLSLCTLSDLTPLVGLMLVAQYLLPIMGLSFSTSGLL